MPNFGSVGKDLTGGGRTALAVWSGTPVSVRVAGSIFMPVVAVRPPHVGLLPVPTLFLAPLDSGKVRAKIVEVTRKLGVEQAMDVRLYHRKTGRLVADVRSGDNGVVEFSQLDPNVEYTLIALDDQALYNADVLDLRRPS